MGFFDFGLSDLFGIGGDAASAAMMSREAEKNRQFQEKVYKHRHQWTTQDMRAAGINPILAAASGQPTTAGSMASMPHMGQKFGTGPKRALEAASARGATAAAEMAKVDADIAKMGYKEAIRIFGKDAATVVPFLVKNAGMNIYEAAGAVAAGKIERSAGRFPTAKTMRDAIPTIPEAVTAAQEAEEKSDLGGSRKRQERLQKYFEETN